MAEDVKEVQKHVRVYIAVFVALAALTLITVSASYLHVSLALHITIALIIATVKGMLVALFFMHLISEKQTIFWVLIFTLAFFLAIMFLPMATDYDMLRTPYVP